MPANKYIQGLGMCHRLPMVLKKALLAIEELCISVQRLGPLSQSVLEFQVHLELAAAEKGCSINIGHFLFVFSDLADLFQESGMTQNLATCTRSILPNIPQTTRTGRRPQLLPGRLSEKRLLPLQQANGASCILS